MIDKAKQYKRQNQWNAKAYDKITISVKKGLKVEWKAKAEAEGLTLREWIEKRVSRD